MNLLQRKQHHLNFMPLLIFFIIDNFVGAEENPSDKYKVDGSAVKKILFSYIAGLIILVIVFVLMVLLVPKDIVEEIGEQEFRGYREVDIELISRS